MPCYFPLTGYRAKHASKSGKYPVVFSTQEGWQDRPVTLPCGRCIGCRIAYSREWALRCSHEAMLHGRNCFLTLTYNDAHLPPGGNLIKRDLILFMKRLRKLIEPLKIRYFGCGEYGEVCFYCGNHRTKCPCSAYRPMLGRPHFHLIIFGYDFPDKWIWSAKNGYPLFRSSALEKIWTAGFTVIGSVSFQSAGYVARYAMKKIGGDSARDWYTRVDPDTGEFFRLNKEFVLMSRGRRKGLPIEEQDGGIGWRWFQKYKSDTDKDFLTLDGKKFPVPKYYTLQRPEAEQEVIKKKRRKAMMKNKDEYSPERLATKERIKTIQLARLIRELH